MIPQSCIDAEMAARVMQSLAVEGHNSIMPQYYEVVLTTKYIHERIHEILADVTNPWLLHDTHIETHDFSIANVRGLDTPFTVQILAHFERKMNAVLIDAEIAGERTIISNRVGAQIHTVVATTSGGAKITRMEGYIV